MLLYGVVLFVLWLLYREKLRSALKQSLPEEFPLIRVVSRSNGIRRIQFFLVWIPFLDGFYLLYHFKKHGMSMVTHYARSVPLTGVFELAVGPFMGFVTNDASVSRKILNSSEPGHLSRPKQMGIFAAFLSKGLLCTPYEIWTNQRKIVSRAFTFRCIQSYVKIMDEQSRQMIKSMRSISAKGDGTLSGHDLMECIHSNVLKITLEFIMGTRTGMCDSEDPTKFSNDLFEFVDIIMYRFFHPECYIPLIWWIHPKQRRGKVLEKRMFTFVEKVIEHYKVKTAKGNEVEVINSDSKAEKRCLVEEMIKYGATTEEIYHEVALFLVAGIETVTTSFNLLLHHLASHPDYQTQCRDEIDNAMGAHDECIEGLDVEKLSKLEFLERFICESLRMTPTVPFTARELGSSLKIDEDLTLNKGQILVISPWIIHHNPKYYPQPDVFDPDRFLPEKVKEREPGAFIPFTAGYRNCIGRRLAMLELKTLAAYILRNFDISSEDGLHNVKLKFEVTVTPENAFRTILTMRNSK